MSPTRDGWRDPIREAREGGPGSLSVTYPDDPPTFDGAQMVVRFTAEVDGVPLACAITAEALEDHFGAPSTLEAELLAAFAAGRDRILAMCTRVLQENGGAAAILRSGLFRMAQP